MRRKLPLTFRLRLFFDRKAKMQLLLSGLEKNKSKVKSFSLIDRLALLVSFPDFLCNSVWKGKQLLIKELTNHKWAIHVKLCGTQILNFQMISIYLLIFYNLFLDKIFSLISQHKRNDMLITKQLMNINKGKDLNFRGTAIVKQ